MRKMTGKNTERSTCWQTECECCFDPCTCQNKCCQRRVRVTCRTPDTICTKKVWCERTVCEQVPCTTMVREKVCTKVPYTVCKKVPYTVVEKVPYTVCRTIRENCTKQVPYTVCRMCEEEIC